jgi:hypothetical protein
MKQFIITILLISLSTYSFSQFGRTYFNTSPCTSNYQTAITLVESETRLVQVINNTSNNELRLKIGRIDTQGELVEAKSILLGVDASINKSMISGFNHIGEERFVLTMLNLSSSTTKLVYYLIEDGELVNTYASNEVLKHGFIPTIAIGDELISYVKSESEGLMRLSFSKSMFSENVKEQVDVSNTIGYNMLYSGKNLVDFKVINGVEYIGAVGTKLYKRNSANSYESQNFNFQLYDRFSIVCAPNAIYVFIEKTGTKFDLNLNLLESKNLQTELIYGTQADSYIAVTTGDFLYLYNSYLESSAIQLNLEMDIVDSVVYQNSIQFNLPFVANNSILLCGRTKSYLTQVNGHLNFDLSNVTLNYSPFVMHVTNFLDEVEFIEYCQSFNTSKIDLKVNNGVDLISDIEGQANFIISNENLSTSSIFQAKNYLIGQNDNLDLISNVKSFFPGPATHVEELNDVFLSKYNRGYFVSREMIEEHVVQIASNSASYIIPFGIREWPAHGDVSLGQEQNLAPFVDVDNDGVYEPEVGDYPSIYGDICVLTIQHVTDQNSGNKLEWHNYFYAFDCHQDSLESNALFVKTDYFNRGGNLHDVYFSNYTDFDLGNYNDDLIGTDVQSGMIYVYNVDDYDEDNTGALGFKDRIPAVGMQLLQGAKLNIDNIDNSIGVLEGESINGVGFGDGNIDNEYYTLESSLGVPHGGPHPNSLYENYVAAKGNTENGSYQYVNWVIVRYSFFGQSDPSFYASNGVDHGNDYWEYSNWNVLGDRSIIGSSGPFDFNTGDKQTFLQVYHYALDTVNPSAMNSLEKLMENAQKFKTGYALNQTSCGNSFDVFETDLAIETNDVDNISIYPNPFKESITITGLDEVGGEIFIYNMEGKILFSDKVNTAEKTISLFNLKAGVYFIQIENGANNYLKKVVKF